MLKLATLIWMMLATALAGAFVIPVLAMPSLSAQGMKLIPYATGAGALLAVPFAFLIARRIIAAAGARRPVR